MVRGGKRSTSWLPAWHLGKTKVIRVPEALADELMEIARRMDNCHGCHVTGNNPMQDSHVTGSQEINLDSHVTGNQESCNVDKIEVNDLIDSLKKLIKKIENKENGYKNNNFGKGIKDLKKINDLLEGGKGEGAL